MVYRQKSRTDDVLEGKELWPGRVVWLDGPNGRAEHIIQPNGQLVSPDEHRRRAKVQAEENRRTYYPPKNRIGARARHSLAG